MTSRTISYGLTPDEGGLGAVAIDLGRGHHCGVLRRANILMYIYINRLPTRKAGAGLLWVCRYSLSI